MPKSKNILLIAFIACWMTNPAFSAKNPEIRGLNINPVSITNESDFNSSYNEAKTENKIEEQINPPQFSESSANLKGGISELNSIVGKSHLIRFDEPIKRLSITNPALADLVLLSPKEMLLNGKTAGITSLIIWGEKGDPIFFDLVIKNETDSLVNTIKTIIPNEKLDLKFTKDSSVILSGKISSILVKNKIKNLVEAYGFKFVDLSEAPTPQVMLEVKVVEASRAFTKNLKVNFALGDGYDSFKFGIIPSTLTSSGKGGVFDGSLAGTKAFLYAPDNKLSSMLNFAEQKGFVKILAEPKLISTHGNKASFNAGNQVPVPTSVAEGGNIAYEFKDVGVNVTFTPTILEDSNRILLNIMPEVSEIDSTTTIQQSNGAVIYGFKTRKADTTVEINNGQTLIMAGLLQKTDNTTKTQVPFMGDLPIIGKIFSSSEFKKGETELIIFVTPRIIDKNNYSSGV